MDLIFLDTTVLCADFRFAGVPWRMLTGSRARLGYGILVPEICRLEAVANFRERLGDAAEKASKASRELQSLIGEPGKIKEIDVEALTQQYQVSLYRALERAEATILSVPQKSHSDVLAALMARRPPFNERERFSNGYRDYLIWTSILDAIAGRPWNAAFVTNNVRDFGRDSLVADLQVEFSSKCPAAPPLRLFETLQALVASVITPELQRLDDLKAALETGRHRIGIQAWLSEHGAELLEYGEPIYLDYKYGVDAEMAVAKSAGGSLVAYNVHDVRALDPDSVMIELVAEFSSAWELHPTPYAEYHVQDARRIFGNDWSTLEMQSERATAEVQIELIANLQTGSIDEYDITYFAVT